MHLTTRQPQLTTPVTLLPVIVFDQVSWAPSPSRKKIYEMLAELIENLGLDSELNRTPNAACDRAREELNMQSAGRMGAYYLSVSLLTCPRPEH